MLSSSSAPAVSISV
ncbi:hypothetical protein A2U01_0060781, partial [Trifolium medium]|nr:hypothetical protein [Trifolium medium]